MIGRISVTLSLTKLRIYSLFQKYKALSATYKTNETCLVFVHSMYTHHASGVSASKDKTMESAHQHKHFPKPNIIITIIFQELLQCQWPMQKVSTDAMPKPSHTQANIKIIPLRQREPPYGGIAI